LICRESWTGDFGVGGWVVGVMEKLREKEEPVL
jgi:hypothetical protein